MMAVSGGKYTPKAPRVSVPSPRQVTTNKTSKQSAVSRVAATKATRVTTPKPTAASKMAAKSTSKPAQAGMVSKPSRPAPKPMTDRQIANRAKLQSMVEAGYQRWSAKNPGGTRSDYRAYAQARFKDMVARSRARKTGA